ncbi:MAG: hypothetical protein MZU95_14660 [Desulfomicrobium escambiense]|nr:hypothetical protein [Desulfomicrobium escambiense]
MGCYTSGVHACGRHHPEETRRRGPRSRARSTHFVAGATDGSWPDYQISALLMAIVLRGMGDEETAWLTEAMARSGARFDLPGAAGPQGRQAQHGRRRRQDVARAGAAGGGLRRGGADDVRARPGPHRRHARQARVDPRVPRRPARPEEIVDALAEVGCVHRRPDAATSRRPTAGSTACAT